MTEREYDNLYNEGAEGFNPFRVREESGEPMWSKIESRLSKITRLLNGLSDNAFDAERSAKLTAERATLKAHPEYKIG